VGPGNPSGGEATGQIRALAGTDPAAATDAAWAASGILHAAAALLDSLVLRQAADFYDRAARAPTDGSPPPPRPGTSCGTPPGYSATWPG